MIRPPVYYAKQNPSNEIIASVQRAIRDARINPKAVQGLQEILDETDNFLTTVALVENCEGMQGLLWFAHYGMAKVIEEINNANY